MIRCFAERPAWRDGAVHLDAGESGHLVRVLRLQAGDPVEVFDGEGRSSAAVIRKADRRAAVLEAGTTREDPAPLPVGLIQAVPKRGRAEWIIQKAVELGVSRLDWVAAERSVVRLSVRDAAARLVRWRAIAIHAAKQCGRNRVPPMAFHTSVRNRAAQGAGDTVWLLCSLAADAQPLASVFGEKRGAAFGGKGLAAVVGPEGDFTEEEIGQWRAAGARPVSLGPAVLRTETAAIFVLSVLVYELGALRD